MAIKKENQIKIQKKHINTALDLISMVSASHASLNTLTRKKIKIRRDKNKNHEGASYRYLKKEIVIPTLMTFENLIEYLIHESRHAWQDAILDMKKEIYLKPKEALIFNRMIEADAFAHTNVVINKINRITGLKIKKEFNIKAKTDNGIRSKTISTFHKSKYAVYYDFLSFVTSMTLLDKNVKKTKTINHSFKKAVSSMKVELNNGLFYSHNQKTLAAIKKDVKKHLKTGFALCL